MSALNLGAFLFLIVGSALVLVALEWANGLETRREPPVSFATGLCLDCGLHRVLDPHGRCEQCGSFSVTAQRWIS